MKEPCSNCGEVCCNGIDCYYKDDPEPSAEDIIETQKVEIAQLKGLVKVMVPVIQVVATAEQHGGADNNHYIFRQFGMKTKAQQILSNAQVRAIMEGSDGKRN